MSLAPGGLWNKLNASQVQYRSRDRVKIVNEYALGRRLGEGTYGALSRTFARTLESGWNRVCSHFGFEGSYGKVKEGVHIQTKRRVAVKIYAHRHIRKIQGGEESARKEIEIMKSLQHANVVAALDDFSSPDKEKLYVVLEYVNGGTLQDLLDRAPNNKLPLKQVKKIFKSLITGLLYLEGNRVVHRDIKPDNILMTCDGEVKIADFGVAVRLDSPDDQAEVQDLFRTGEGSVAFQPPECQEFSPRPGSAPDVSGMQKKKISILTAQKLDVWSAGVVLYIMITGKYPFDNPNIITLFSNIAHGEFTIPSWITSEELKDLIKGTIQVNAEKRYTLLQVKKHIWLKTPLPKESVSALPIEPIPSLFGYDNETLMQVLESLKTQQAHSEEESVDKDFDSKKNSRISEVSETELDSYESSRKESDKTSTSSDGEVSLKKQESKSAQLNTKKGLGHKRCCALL